MGAHLEERIEALQRDRRRRLRGTALRVYVFAGRNCVKIGVTWDAQVRWNKLKRSNPYLEPPHFVSAPTRKAITIERAAHEELKPYCIVGEWFSCSRYLATEVVIRLIEKFDASS